MIAEITAACRFFAQQLNQPSSSSSSTFSVIPLDHSQIQLFESELAHALQERFLGHWYAENPIKGQAYRSILADFEHGLVDSALTLAAERSKIHDFLSRALPSVRMWVDPGEVSVEPIRGRSREVILYRSRSAPTLRNKSSSSSSSSLSANAAPFQSRKSPPLGPMSAPSLSSYHVSSSSTSGLYTAADHERLHASSSTYLHPSYDQQIYYQQQQQQQQSSNLWNLESQPLYHHQQQQQHQSSAAEYYLHSAARNQLAY